MLVKSILSFALFSSLRAAPLELIEKPVSLEKRAIASSWPATLVAPFCDVLLWPTFDVNAAAAATGSKYFTLAFITADGSGLPSWGGSVPLAQDWYLDKVTTLRASGGDVIISFGGAIGTELATFYTDVLKIQAAYQSVIDTYKVTWVDFDIEGGAVADSAANTRRAQALVALKQANPGLIVSFTLPVLPTGLDWNGANVLAIAAQNKLTVDVINIMAMDYGGSSVAPNGATGMGGYAIQAAQATFDQAKAAGLTNYQIGITPMIGQNDVSSEMFRLEDAKQLLSFAQKTSWVKWIGYWSVNRDTHVIGALYQSSQIVQTDYQFLSTFAPFTTGVTVVPSTSGGSSGGSTGSGGSSSSGGIAPLARDPSLLIGYNWPTKVFAPFVDATNYPTYDIVSNAYKTGVVNYVLAFIVSGSNGQPSWGGYYGLSASWFTEAIKNIRQFGGDVIISFGGASGQELALTSTSVNALQGHYQDVIDSYAISWIDFDIEGSALADKASVDRRNQALRGIQVNDPNMIISYTLPVMPEGLTADGLYLLQSAIKYGVRVDVVNIMTMDYGTTTVMGDAAISAASATWSQISSLGLKNTNIGITPMIGQNDVSNEIFTAADATKVIAWASSQSYIGFVSFWSAARDNAQKSSDLGKSTNIVQSDSQFTFIFEQFSN